MKASKLIVLISSILVVSSITVSCKKDKKEDVTDSDTSAAADHSYVENLSNDMDNIGDQAGNSASGSSLSTYKIINPGNSLLSTCAVVSVFHADSTNSDTLLVDFGATNCVGNDGRVRNGQIRYVYSGGKHYRDSGIVITVTPINYSVEGNQVSGTKTITNKGRISNGNFVWEISSNLSIVKANNGGTLTWSCSRTKTLLNTASVYSGPAVPINWPQAKIAITGNATGTSAAGNSYTASITNALIRDFTCSPSPGNPHRHPFIQGTFDFTPSGKATRTVDFGAGTCDMAATVTINGNTYNIML
ncbi:MAG: hypothetical protein K0S33_1204 [Bacteroidetes bacterium]|jgi:hypothetical protein|nr:hypothetical protein [Bacteroidota bacterium]